MTDEVNVQLIVDVEADDTAGIPAFRDAIYLPLSEYQGLTPRQVEKRKQDRYVAWRKLIENPEPVMEPVQVEVSAEDRQAQLAGLVADLAAVTAQVQTLVDQQTQQEPTPTDV